MSDHTFHSAMRGQQPSAEAYNRLRQLAERPHFGAGVSQMPYGVEHVPVGPDTPLELYEITVAATRDTDSREWYVMAKPVAQRWVTVDGDNHYAADAVAGDAGAVLRLRQDSDMPEETVWLLGVPLDADQEPEDADAPPVGHRLWTSVWCGLRVQLAGGGGVLTPFELYDDLNPGDVDKNAYPLAADLTADTSKDKILVCDGILGDVRALGSNTKTGGTPATGARGYYTVGPDGKNQIVSIQRLARTIIVANTASGHAAVAKTTSGFTATLTRVCDDGQNPLHGSATSLVVYNPGFPVADAQTGIICVLDNDTGVTNCIYRMVTETVTKCLGTLNGALSSASGTASVTITDTVCGFGPASTTVVTANNTFNWSGASGKKCLIEFNADENTWILTQLEC